MKFAQNFILNYRKFWQARNEKVLYRKNNLLFQILTSQVSDNIRKKFSSISINWNVEVKDHYIPIQTPFSFWSFYFTTIFLIRRTISYVRHLPHLLLHQTERTSFPTCRLLNTLSIRSIGNRKSIVLAHRVYYYSRYQIIGNWLLLFRNRDPILTSDRPGITSSAY